MTASGMAILCVTANTIVAAARAILRRDVQPSIVVAAIKVMPEERVMLPIDVARVVRPKCGVLARV